MFISKFLIDKLVYKQELINYKHSTNKHIKTKMQINWCC